METIAFVLDIFLVIAAFAAYLARPRIGGQLARGMRSLTTGLLVLGFAHLTETLLFAMFFVDRPINRSHPQAPGGGRIYFCDHRLCPHAQGV